MRTNMIAGLGAALALTGAMTAGVTTASAAPLPAWECNAGTFCLYDGDNGVGRFYTATGGCWFINIGLEGHGDKANSAYNRTGRRVNIANWNGSAWEHLAGVPAGGLINLGANRNRADAIHSIC
ncbi:peptidase inhibitor family I36 protein [Lentzea alba]|uniref:peptidase inhibitor family I36 protein n=1 Tax=Lentzea alba TaxID=2714351 RepID=UPI0039BF8D1A